MPQAMRQIYTCSASALRDLPDPTRIFHPGFARGVKYPACFNIRQPLKRPHLFICKQFLGLELFYGVLIATES